MSITVKLRRGTTTQHSAFTGEEAEVTVDTTKDVVVVHDGVTAGGHPMAKASSLATVATTGDYNDLINTPSGGSGTVTSVALSAPTGFSVSGSPVTTTGTLALAFSAGYALPTTTKQSQWDTAYAWGNHASAGYLDAADIGVTVQGYNANTVIDASYVHTDNNYTTAEQTKLAGIAAGAEVNVNADWNAVSGDAQILNKPTLYSDAAVDTHLNTSTATSAQVLSWTGTDYDWVTPSAGGGGALTISNKTAAYTVVAGDLGTIINCTSGTFTVSLTAAATLGAGFNCWIWNTSTSGVADTITIDPNGAETIDGRTTLVLRRGEGMQIVCDGTNFQTGDKKVMRGYAENLHPSVTRPSATGGSAIALVDGAVASGSFSLALGSSTTASSTGSTAIGVNSSNSGSQAVTGSGAMALGGSYASGSNSFAAAIADNTSSYGATGNNSLSMGYLSKASNQRAVAIGYQAIASAFSSVSIGSYGSATATGAVVIAADDVSGNGTNASAANAFALGLNSSSAIIGKYAYASGLFASPGDAQTGTFILRKATTDATASALVSNTSAAGASNQIILPNNSAFAFTGIIIARQKAANGTASAAWKVEGLIRREGTAASTTLVASTVTAISNVPGWTLALSADTTNGGLAVTFTGAAATNIRTVATIQTSEVTYA